MTSVWLMSLGSVVVVSLMSLTGVITLLATRHFLTRFVFILVSLSVGALFGDVFLHILPEIFEVGISTESVAILVIGGILCFFILEKFFRWEHHHQVDEEDNNMGLSQSGHNFPNKSLGYLNITADAVHNLIDGVVIGIAYLASPAVGLATTIAVVLHEIPQEIGDFGVLLHAGFSVKKALWLNLLSAGLAVVGVIAALFLGKSLESATPYVLALAAGGFIYIAGSDLVPELHKSIGVRIALIQFISIVVGVGLMLSLTLLE